MKLFIGFKFEVKDNNIEWFLQCYAMNFDIYPHLKKVEVHPFLHDEDAVEMHATRHHTLYFVKDGQKIVCFGFFTFGSLWRTSKDVRALEEINSVVGGLVGTSVGKSNAIDRFEHFNRNHPESFYTEYSLAVHQTELSIAEDDLREQAQVIDGLNSIIDGLKKETKRLREELEKSSKKKCNKRYWKLVVKNMKQVNHWKSKYHDLLDKEKDANENEDKT